MKNLLLICIILGFSNLAHAGWFCEEGSSQKSGSVIETCGVGTGLDENMARVNAYNNAKTEFSLLCKDSYDCKDHKISVTPKRTSCEKSLHGFVCYRMLAYEIGEEKSQRDNVAQLYWHNY